MNVLGLWINIFLVLTAGHGLYIVWSDKEKPKSTEDVLARLIVVMMFSAMVTTNLTWIIWIVLTELRRS